MDIKRAFLNGYIVEEVYVEQPPGIKIFEYRNHVYKLDNALYGLNKLLELGMKKNKFHLEKKFSMREVDIHFFTK